MDNISFMQYNQKCELYISVFDYIQLIIFCCLSHYTIGHQLVAHKSLLRIHGRCRWHQQVAHKSLLRIHDRCRWHQYVAHKSLLCIHGSYIYRCHDWNPDYTNTAHTVYREYGILRIGIPCIRYSVYKVYRGEYNQPQ